MDLARGFRTKNLNRIKQFRNERIGLNSDTILVIKLPHSRVLRVLSQSLFFVAVILTWTCIGSNFWEPSSFSSPVSGFHDTGSDSIDFEFLDVIFKDLADEGLVKKGDKGLIVSSGIVGVMNNLPFVNANEIELIMASDSETQSSISDETFDFVFTSASVNAKFVDRVVKIGGIVAALLSKSPLNEFREQSNYKIVYLRRYNSTILAIRKTGQSQESVGISIRRRLCNFASDGKKAAALKDLEDVLLEPPRPTLTKSNNYLNKIKYLPDLLGDSLEDYPRRVFVNVGLAEKSNGITEWFLQNYPTKNQDFEIYSMENAPEEEYDVSDWLANEVEEEEYVVMKAEAEVVEEMIRRRTICLVDELFLECKNQWENEGKKKSKRAYWECLALYGRLRDEGVAVHQWWS